ncbi:MAG: cytochrome c3 family protein, partial [Pseudomonadota bacterium]
EMDCAGCHQAAQSASSTDVLMPQIDTCRDCHRVEGGEDELLAYLTGLTAQFTSNEAAAQTVEVATAQPAPATCVTCHGFHSDGDEDVPAMSPAHAEAWRAAHGGSGAE